MESRCNDQAVLSDRRTRRASCSTCSRRCAAARCRCARWSSRRRSSGLPRAACASRSRGCSARGSSSATSAGSTGSAAPPRRCERRVAAWRDLRCAAAAVVRRLDRRLRGSRRDAAVARVAAAQRARAAPLGLPAARARARACDRTTSRGGVARVREELPRSGSRPAPSCANCANSTRSSDARARKLWDADDLVAALPPPSPSSSTRARGACAARSPRSRWSSRSASAARCCACSRTIPLLPEPIVAAAERAALVAAMRDYDAIGRASWSGFLSRHGVRARQGARRHPSTGARSPRGGLR